MPSSNIKKAIKNVACWKAKRWLNGRCPYLFPGILEKLKVDEALNWEFMINSDLFDEACRQQDACDWMKWLGENLVFPFIAERVADDGVYFSGVPKDEHFRLGHTMKALNLSYEDDLYGVIVRVREKCWIGSVPLCELKAIPENDRNFQPIEEYRDWFANR